MNKNLQRLLNEKVINNKILNNATATKDIIDDELNDEFLKLHCKLIDLDFYEQIVGFYSYQKKPIQLNRVFGIDKYKLPYRYCGEGDYRQIVFSIENDNLRLDEFYTYDESDNGLICTIPLNLFDNDDNLRGYIESMRTNQQKNIDTTNNKEKDTRIKHLEEALKKLKS